MTNYREQFYEGEIDGKTLLDVIDEKEGEAQALREEVAALRARVVVFPDFDNDVIIETFRRNGFRIELGETYSVKGQIAQLLNALGELARLNGKVVSEAELAELQRDAERYRWVKQRAWYVDRAAEVYGIDHIKVAGFREAVPVDDDDVEAAIDKAMAEDDLLGEGKES